MNNDVKKLKVVFFSPHAYIWQHAFLEALVAKSLKDAGHDVLYITCDGILSDGVCISMRVAAADFDSELERKKHICNNCIKNKNSIVGVFNFSEEALGSYLTKEDFNLVDTELQTITKTNFFSYMFDGLPIGRMATFEVMIQFKKNSFDFTDEEFYRYKIWLRNSLFVAVAARKILLKHSPDRVIIYNNIYSANNAFNATAKKMGILSYSMHGWHNLGELYQGLEIMIGYSQNYPYNILERWDEYKHIPVSKNTIGFVKSHLDSLLGSKTVFTYSNPVAKKYIDVREYFDIPDNSKIALAIMSSYDEVYAAYAVGAYETHESKMYKNQVLWLKDLIDFFSKREDLFLIIRIHPREFPNKRDACKSENATVYEGLLTNLPSNIKANMPSDNLSIYDLAPNIDIALNGFSSAGFEMAILGIPVLSSANEFNVYPIDLDYFATSRNDYFEAIDKLITSGWSADRVKMACRWLAFKLAYAAFYLGDAFSYKPWERINQEKDLRELPSNISAGDKIAKFICSGEDIFIDKDKIISEPMDYSCENVIIKDFIRETYGLLFENNTFGISSIGRQIKLFIES